MTQPHAANGSSAPKEPPLPEGHAMVSPFPPPHSVSETPKNPSDILAYEDKWIGWDGPVWCSRYGRFENKTDAARDDGYTKQGAGDDEYNRESTEDTSLHRCEKHSCSCRAPFQHLSYVKDIQRRVEPMVQSLVVLEQQVGRLVHHVMQDGESMLHHGHVVQDGPRGKNLPESRETLEEKVARLEHKVGSLMHQLHQNVHDNDALVGDNRVRNNGHPHQHDGDVNYPGGIVGSASNQVPHGKHDGEVNYPGGIVGSSG